MRNIKDVVSNLNALLAKTELSKFYDLRAKLKGGNRWHGGLLQATFGGDAELSGYSFHKGGAFSRRRVELREVVDTKLQTGRGAELTLVLGNGSKIRLSGLLTDFDLMSQTLLGRIGSQK